MQAVTSTINLPDVEPAEASSADDDTSLSTLLGGIVSDLQQLMEDHLHLLKLEVQDDLQKGKNAIIPMAIGWGLLVAACMLFLVMLIGWLSWLQPEIPWFTWSGILALCIGVTGGIFLIIARQRWQLVHAVPQKTIRQVKRTIQSINDQVHTEQP